MNDTSPFLAQKWDPKKHEYYLYVLPKGAALYETDMDKIVSCAQCSDKLSFGQCYTSKQVHTSVGLGFGVCLKCYQEEVAEERLA